MKNITFQVSNLATSYKKFKLSNVTFSLKNGDIMGLVGKSGAGKSTFIKTVIGVKRADFGSIRILQDNVDVSLRSISGYSPQQNSLYPFLTLEENIYTFGELHKVPRATIKKRLGFLLQRLDLQNSRKKRIIELSGGMQKRADLAVSFIHDPDVLVLDEPFAGLDNALQRFIWKLLIEWSKQGKIIIVSSHMLDDLQKNCNEFGLIYNKQFYNTAQVQKSFKQSRKKNLEEFFISLFEEELKAE